MTAGDWARGGGVTVKNRKTANLGSGGEMNWSF